MSRSSIANLHRRASRVTSLLAGTPASSTIKTTHTTAHVDPLVPPVARKSFSSTARTSLPFLNFGSPYSSSAYKRRNIMPVYDYVTLNTGDKMPVYGLGTWKSKPGQVEHAVEFALKDAGYRHIDTAAAYQNETEVGQGIKASKVKREDIFLTTKLDNPDQGDPEAALLSSLQKLDTPYLDLWLMHWPAPMTEDGEPNRNIDWLDTWKAMVNVKKLNPDKVKAIGVSNFSVEFLSRLLENSDYVPAVNQIELHPSCPQSDVRKFCKEKGIVVTAYSPLGSDNSPLLTNETVVKIAERHNVHPANILISIWANTENTTVIPKSVTNSRIENNKKLVSLSEEEIDELLKISEKHHFRACNPEWTGWGDLGFPDRKGVKK